MASVALSLMVLGAAYIAQRRGDKRGRRLDTDATQGMMEDIQEGFVNAETVPDAAPHSQPAAFDAPRQVECDPSDIGAPCPTAVVSLTGETIDPSVFRHNNMQPFFGAKVRGPNPHTESQCSTRLDNMQGAGTFQIRKTEEAPLFAPSDSMSFVDGTPSMTDFLQSRVNPGRNQANTKPFETVNVGPGLDAGYSADGRDGFNSGMAGREGWLPPTVDDLRCANNPKQSFDLSGHAGPARAHVTNASSAAMQGVVERHGPDITTFMGAERFMTDVGAVKASPARSAVQDAAGCRGTDCTLRFGASAGVDGGEGVRATVQEPHRIATADDAYLGTPAVVHGGGAADTLGRDGTHILANNRSVLGQQPSVGNLRATASALLAPITAAVRHTRKTFAVGSVRPNGNVQPGVEAGPVFNPADRTRTTEREMTANTSYMNVVPGSSGTGYLIQNDVATTGQRATTSCPVLPSAAPVSQTRETSHASAYRQRNNNKKQAKGQANPGGMGLTSHVQNLKTRKVDARATTRRSAVDGPAMGASARALGEVERLKVQRTADRTQSFCVEQFKRNPYTHSLKSI